MSQTMILSPNDHATLSFESVLGVHRLRIQCPIHRRLNVPHNPCPSGRGLAFVTLMILSSWLCGGDDDPGSDKAVPRIRESGSKYVTM